MTQNSLLKTQAFIDGSWIGTPSFPVLNPSTGKEIARVPDMGATEARQAIEAAHKAFPAWSTLLAAERGAFLRRWYNLIIENADALAEILTLEEGKPLAEAKGEIIFAAGFVEYYAEEARRIYGEIIPSFRAGSELLVLKRPLGVVAAITPWNFPSAMVTRKVAPALAAGCTVVCKPAEDTPLCALALAALAEQAGFPNGVVNFVTAANPEAIGKELSTHPLVRCVTFTGSTEVGRILMRQASDTVKKMSLELGGNAPFIVFDDADLDAAITGLMAVKFRNAGQTCVCPNRIFIQDKIYDVFAAKLVEAAKKIKVGDGLESGVTLGPLINKAAVDKVKAHIEDAVQKGAKLILGGKAPALGGNFFEPTILTGVTKNMRLMDEETFGPVAALIKFSDEKEVIALANDTIYGLGGYFYARDIGRVWRVAEALECGVMGVNSGLVPGITVPHCGMKQSGLGCESGHHGIEEFVALKYIYMAV